MSSKVVGLPKIDSKVGRNCKLETAILKAGSPEEIKADGRGLFENRRFNF